MSKILIEGNKVIIDGHANDLETCNTLTNLCDELSISDKFRTVKYERGYGEFESISENKEKKFIEIPLPPPPIPFDIYSNNGTTLYYSGDIQEMDLMEVTSTGMSINGSSVYTYSGNKVFLGFSDKVNSTSATFPVGYTGTGIDISASNELYIVEANPGSQVNIQSNDGTATLTQNATVNSVVVTSTGAQLKYGDTVNATYTYDGSKLFAGLATSANATAPKYKPGDTIEITAATTFYIVENIIIPEHHSSLTELFTNIASVIREKTGDTASIVADEFPSVIRSNLRPSQFEPDGASYLTFSSPNSFTLKVNDTTKHWDGTLEYFDLDRTWAVWDGTTTLSSVDNYGKHVLYLRGTGNKTITGSDDYKWVLTGSDISCIGNIEYLLDYATVESGVNPTMAGNCYKNMFQDCTALTKAPDLPATTLKSDCYSYMFYGCTSLIQAPALPATTLADYCYYYMFKGCTSLTQAPALPATTLANRCYQNMFYVCTSLTQAPALPATMLANCCYQSMFQGCTSLIQAPALPATTLASSCYKSMFQGCTALAKAPDLPATTLAISCYQNMFYGCTSLTQAPALPATTLKSDCYSYMFKGCTALAKAPALPATTLVESCYQNMFYGCTALTKTPALPATTLAIYCYSYMFYGCTSLTQAPALPATTLTNRCYGSMFQGCTALTKAPALPATTLEGNCYSYMFNGCTALTQAPALPATTLANYCYQSMFQGCTRLKFSTTYTGEYTIAYRIPSSGTGTTASDALSDMLYGTGGTFKGTPEINTTYYLSNTNQVISPTSYAH